MCRHPGAFEQQGCAITIATMTPGDCGSAEHSAEEIADIRRDEARNRPRSSGRNTSAWSFATCRSSSIIRAGERSVEALRRARPDIVLTAPPIDYMTDHEVTSVLVREACFSASVPNYSTRQWDPAPPMSGDSAPVLCRLGRRNRLFR